MGEQQSGGGSSGRRRAHPHGMASGRASGPAVALDDAELEALLSAAVLRGHRVDAEGEQRAVAAFRAARAAGEHRAGTRRRDDWRPRGQRRLGRSLRTALSLVAASLTLGGVAFAAIGSSAGRDTPAGDKGGPASSAGAPDRPAAGRSATASGVPSATPDHPVTAQDTEARCRAYEQVTGRGNALDATAWQRLVSAAGGADKVAAYCAEQLARATDPGRPSQAATPGGAADDATKGAGDAGGGADNGTGGVDSGADGAENATGGAAGSGAGGAEGGAPGGARAEQGNGTRN